ncbi:Actin-related protein 4, partial [Tetrabaena socialis]
VAADMKESVCRVSDTRYSEADSGPMPTTVYELPDGQELFLGQERVKMGEV